VFKLLVDATPHEPVTFRRAPPDRSPTPPEKMDSNETVREGQ